MLTHFLGPAFANCEGKPQSVFLTKLGISRDLIQQLPKVSYTRIKMHYDITDTVAFQEQEFRTSVQFTHEIPPLSEEVLWANLRNKTRNVIRRAQEQVELRDLADPDEFLALYVNNLKARKLRCFLDLPVCSRLIGECIRLGRGKIVAAVDQQKRLVAANFYVWDQRSFFYLLSTRVLEAGNGVTSLLIWQALQETSRRGLTFDSDGLSSRGSILFLTGLGGKLEPRFIVSKSFLSGIFLETLQEAVWGTNYFVRG
jgi:hypothetical protein